MRIAVTGANGFIGNNLVRYLHSHEYEVVALIRTQENAVQFNKAGIETCITDISDRASLEDAFNSVDIVMHLAALFNCPGASAEDYYLVNVEGTRNVLETADKMGVKRVIHCSTGGVVAWQNPLPLSEVAPYSTPEWNTYEVTKRQGEELAIDYSLKHRLEVVIIRPSQPYGPGDKSKAKFYKMVKKGIIVNPGKTLKHPIYIDDLCRAFEIAAKIDNISGEIFTIGGNKSILLTDLTGIIARELKVDYPGIIIPAAPMTIFCTVIEALCKLLRIKPILNRRSMDFFRKSIEFDITKAKSFLGFESQVSIENGVQNTADWYRQENLLG